jgi:multidrug efflux pump subunit AcrB
MEITGIDMQRISLGALIIALALLVDDAMTTTDATLSRLAQGDDIVDAATFAFRTYALAMLAGTLVTIAGFVPVGFAASSAGEYTFSLFAVVAMALIVSWFVAVIFAPLLGVLILSPPKSTDKKEGFLLRAYRGLLTGAIRARWLTIPVTLALFVASLFAVPLIPNQFFPSSDRPELLVDLTLHKTRPSRDQDRGGAVRQGSQGRSGRRAVEHLCWPRRHPLLSPSRCAVAQRFFWSGRRRSEGCAGARAPKGQT